MPGSVRALVTGASGFLGGRLVDMLLAGVPPVDGPVEVTTLARPTSALGARPGLHIVRAELTAAGLAEPAVRAALSETTHIFHCAGCSTDWAAPAEYEAANIGAVAALLTLAAQAMPRLQRFVHVSTTDVYGYPQLAADEAMPPRDIGLPYNRSKLRGEQLVWDALAAGLPVTILRPASIYGPGGKAFVTDIVALLRQRLMLLVDGGKAPGGFVYVDDVCRAMLLAARAPGAYGQALNLSSTDSTSWRAYAAALAQALGLPDPWLQLPFQAAMLLATLSELPHRAYLPGRPLLTRHAVYLLGRDQQYSVRKAREVLGWQPQVSLREGIALCAAAVQARSA